MADENCTREKAAAAMAADEPRPIITRAEAKALGLKFWFSGKPCKHGHLEERYVSSGACIACGRAYANEQYASDPEAGRAKTRNRRAADPEKARAQARARNAADPRRFEKRRAEYQRKKEDIKPRQRAYYLANREQVLFKSQIYRAPRREEACARTKAWKAKNPERAKASFQAWAKANPGALRSYGQNYRARKRGAEGWHTAEDIERIRKLQKDRCAECRKPLRGKGERDHIVALVRGGSNWPSNIQLLCRGCNARKHGKDVLDWARENNRLL